MLTTPDPRDMGDHEADHAAHDCSCSEANAQELLALVTALAAHHGIDLDDDTIDEDDEHAMDLRLIYDVLLAQGATEEDDDDEDEDEPEVSRFAEGDGDDTDGDDDGDDDEGSDDDLDIIELDIDEDEDGDDEDGEDEADDSSAFSDDDPADPDPDVIHGLATFDLESPVTDGEFVRYEGARIFRPGSFPKKKFDMSPEELRSAVDRFHGRAVPAEIEHVNSAGTATFLDGEFGTLENLRMAEDGWAIGDVVLDRWVDRKWDKFLAKAGETRKQVSAVWNRATKDIERLGLVIKGHVEGAALNAMFGDRDDDSAIDAMFATPRKHDEHLSRVWQLMHDQAAMIPGVCPANSPAMMGDLTQQYKHLKHIHDNSVTHGAKCGSGKAMMSESDTEPRSNPMPDKSTAVETPETPEVTDAELAEFVESSAQFKALAAELAALKAENAAATARFAEAAEATRVKAVEAAAHAFADAEIAQERSTTAEFTDLVLSYIDAADLDHKLAETVTFSDAAGAKATGSRVDRLKAREAKRPKHGLFAPALGDGKLLNDGERLLFNDKPALGDEASDRAAADAVLAKTNDGRAVLSRRGK